MRKERGCFRRDASMQRSMYSKLQRLTFMWPWGEQVSVLLPHERLMQSQEGGWANDDGAAGDPAWPEEPGEQPE